MATVELEALADSPSRGGIEAIVAAKPKKYSDEHFPEVQKFLGDHLPLFFKEYGITDVTMHSCETLTSHPIEDEVTSMAYGDTYYMMIRDQDGDTIHFQKYNRFMIVSHEIRKILKKDGTHGGEFEVAVYDIGQDVQGPFLRENASPRRIADFDNLMKARIDALKYMQSVVKYHDIEIHDKPQEGLVRDTTDNNRFSVAGNSVSFLFDYRWLPPQHLAGFEGLHEKTIKYLRERVQQGTMAENVGNELITLVQINQSFYNAAKQEKIIR